MSTGKVGRPPQPIVYVDVCHTGKDYVVGFIDPSSSETPLTFVFDKDVEEMVKAKSWHKCSTNYIASTAKDPYGAQCQLFLHNLVMGKLTFDGKGQVETVDHVNRNGFDNRKENLRILDQRHQNINQGRKPRRAVLPDDCGLTADDIPRHIWYIKANGLHGDRFAIEFKTEGTTWKTTSSKKVPLTKKLDDAKAKLREFYALYPYLDPDEPFKLEKEKYLTESYLLIVEKAQEARETTIMYV
jgi:hypothetical protein